MEHFWSMNIRKFENLHILMWLLKDLCWVTLSELMGVIMIVPTIGLAIYITWLSRHEQAELFHNLAVCFWIGANSIWMIGEFFYDDSTRGIATAFFIIGLLFIGWYYALWLKNNHAGYKG
jgi:hypothetical protein